MKTFALQILISAVVAGACPAQQDAARQRGFAVRCVTQMGEPVAGATVHLFQQAPTPDGKSLQRPFGPYETNADGVVRCPVALTFRGRRFDRWAFARVPGRWIGVGRGFQANEFGAVDADDVLDVVMCPVRELRSVVRVPDGSDPTKVRIRIVSLAVEDGTTPFGSTFPRNDYWPGLDGAVSDYFEVSPDEDGRYVFRDVPMRGRIHVVAELDGLGQAQGANIPRAVESDDDPFELTLRPEAVLGGSVVGPDGAPVRDAEVRARLAEGPSLFHLSTFVARTDADGAFRIAGLPESAIDVTVDAGRRAGVFSSRRIDVTPGSESRLTFAATVGTRVSGVVVDSEDDAPVVGANVIAITGDDRRTRLDVCSTDEAGRFELLLPEGPVQLYFGGVPVRYEYPDPQIIYELDASGAGNDFEGLRFALDRRQE